MKKVFNLKWFLVLVISSFVICTIAGEVFGEVIVYGRKTCGLCVQMMKNLDSANIQYTFKDIDDSKNLGKIDEKLKRAGIKGSFRLPLMDINGIVKASPSFEEVEKILKNER